VEFRGVDDDAVEVKDARGDQVRGSSRPQVTAIAVFVERFCLR
jgi:hypothetical protein